jgi:phosphoglycolate phosphatase-like HAD superfamily hydrolase
MDERLVPYATERCGLLKRALVLWDVDHTLIQNGGVSVETYALAFERITGRAPSTRPATDGRTDYQIMRELFAANDEPMNDRIADRLFSVLVSAMQENAAALRERGQALPGAVDALAALKGGPSVVQSVLSGNILPNAFVKLEAFGLDEYLDFDVGGYGSDDIVRANLVGAAQHKARAKYGVTFDRASTLLIGDTPRDVEAGLKGGAQVLGVATGKSSEQELTDAGAHAVLPDLIDTAAFLRVVRDLVSIGATTAS